MVSCLPHTCTRAAVFVSNVVKHGFLPEIGVHLGVTMRTANCRSTVGLQTRPRYCQHHAHVALYACVANMAREEKIKVLLFGLGA